MVIGTRARVVGAIVAASLWCAALASAQDAPTGAESAAHDEEARALFEAGRVAFSDGRFEDALTHFERSYELSGRAELLYNIGTSQDRLRREPEAVAAFERYLELVPDAENRREVEGRLRVLREEIAREAELAAERESARPEVIPASAVDTTEADAPAGGGEDVLTAWWLWTIIGVVVAGAVVGGVLAATVQTGDVYPEYMRGTGDAIAITLTVSIP